MVSLADYINHKKEEFKGLKQSILDKLEHHGFLKSNSASVALVSANLNAINRVVNLIRSSYLYNASEVRGSYYLHPGHGISSIFLIVGDIKESTYLDYKEVLSKKILSRKERLKYVGDILDRMEKEINVLGEYLNSHDNSIYKSFTSGEMTNMLYQVEQIATILEYLRLSISVKPGKVTNKYVDVKMLLGLLNSKLRELYHTNIEDEERVFLSYTTGYDELKEEGLLADLNRANDANYIGNIIDKVYKYLNDYFANAGEKDRNNLHIGEKSNNS